MSAEAGQELTPRTSLKPIVQQWLDRLEMDVKMDDGSDDWGIGIDSMAERILLAETEDEIFAAGEMSATTGGRDYTNEPFLLKSDGYKVKRSNMRGENGEAKGIGYFLLMRVVDMGTGDEKILNTGAPAVVTQTVTLGEKGILAKYDADGGMPLMIGSKPAGEGNVLFLKPFRGLSRAKAKKS